MQFDFFSKIFDSQIISLASSQERVVKGGRNLFPLLPKAFEGVRQIGVLGWGSQGPAQAQNLRDSLEGSSLRVKVGLRKNSSSWKKAQAAGFHESQGTLGELMEVAAESDMVLLLIADAAQPSLYKKLFSRMKPGSTLGLSHGFLHGYLTTKGEQWPEKLNIIGVCPKGMGPSVRRLYEQGKDTAGAGINTSFAVEQDLEGKATDYALAWSIALGAPFTFMTSLENEYRSDIFGERGILLGAVHGIVEFLFRLFREQGLSDEEAFMHSAESITGPITQTISTQGILPLYQQLSAADKKTFQHSYARSYSPMKSLLTEIYQEVQSGNEIRSVILAGKRMETYPMSTIDHTHMWQVGNALRAKRPLETPINAITAGIYVACMMAQVDVLKEYGHSYSEIVNESIIEAVDSLNPYMHYRGVSYMVDNCSTTARLGARKWAPRFDYALYQEAFSNDSKDKIDSSLLKSFEEHPVHDAVSTLLKFRPSLSISL